MIITIAGKPGSGKTTVGKILKEKLGYKFKSMGDIRGQLAVDRGITIDELNKIGETESWTDEETDNYLKKLGEQDNLVIDTRLGWYFLENSVKVIIDVDPKIGAERVYKSQQESERPDERKYDSVEDVMQSLKKRVQSDTFRYNKYYKIKDYLATGHYELVVDSSHKTPEQVVDIILDYIEKRS